MTRFELSAEQSVAGALLVFDECIPQVLGLLNADDFRTEHGRAVFETVKALYDAGQTVTPQVVADKLAFSSGAGDYIMSAMEEAAWPQNVAANCRIMQAAAKADRLRDIAVEIAQYDGGALGVADMVDSLRAALDSFDDVASGAVSGSDALASWARYYDTVSANPDAAYCKTGYLSLDVALGGGLFNGEVYVLAGRPGMGKTTQGINIAERAAKSGRPVLYVSLEMSVIQITAKRLANASGVNYTGILSGNLREEQRAEVYRTAPMISDRPFFIADKAHTVGDIQREAMRLKDLALIVVDYMGLLQTGDKPAPRYEEMTRISGQLKAMALRLNKPVLALAQLNRENTNRGKKRPMLSDLRDSGAIEQDAGGVILLHRDSYYKPEEQPPDVEPMELIIAKNRHAQPQTVKMMWHGATGQITDTAWINED